MNPLGIAVFTLLAWAVGALHGAFLWERAHADRTLAEIVDEVCR